MCTKILLCRLFAIFLVFNLTAQAQDVSRLDTIENTETDPYKFICYQYIHRDRALKDHYYQSTGFLIARNVVLTAAHNLYSVTGSRVDEITIYPGRYKDSYPYDSIVIKGQQACKNATRVNAHFKWGKVSYDFAIIIIPEKLLAKAHNWPSASLFEIDANEILKTGDLIHVAGFPASGGYNGSLMTYQNQHVGVVDQTTIPHSLKTETGNSGSPIWIERNGKFKIVGIHTYAGLATKLTVEDIAMINKWMGK